MEAKTEAAGRISYEEFEPYCEWQREETRDTLVVHVPEFNREQLKVQINNNRGTLKVSGERTVDARKKSKFHKEFVVPMNCNINDIHAKFAKGQLSIIMPKYTDVVVPEKTKSQQVADSKNSTLGQNTQPGAIKDQTTLPDERSNKKDKMVPSPTPNGSASTKSKDYLGGEKSVPGGKQLAEIAVNVGMLVAVLAALMAFVYYMLDTGIFSLNL